MKLLAVDVTGDWGSLAILEGASVLEEVELHSPDGFGHMLFPAIQELMAKHSLTLRDLDGFAAASGPGSFTGVRVGLSAVKGLAEALELKVAAVSNLQALASLGRAALRAPVIDARRGQIFGAVYAEDLGIVQEETVMEFSRWAAQLPADVELVTRGLAIPPELRRFAVTEASRPLAAAIGRIGAWRFGQGMEQDPMEIDANYVRRSDAELFWKDAV